MGVGEVQRIFICNLRWQHHAQNHSVWGRENGRRQTRNRATFINASSNRLIASIHQRLLPSCSSCLPGKGQCFVFVRPCTSSAKKICLASLEGCIARQAATIMMKVQGTCDMAYDDAVKQPLPKSWGYKVVQFHHLQPYEDDSVVEMVSYQFMVLFCMQIHQLTPFTL